MEVVDEVPPSPTAAAGPNDEHINNTARKKHIKKGTPHIRRKSSDDGGSPRASPLAVCSVGVGVDVVRGLELHDKDGNVSSRLGRHGIQERTANTGKKVLRPSKDESKKKPKAATSKASEYIQSRVWKNESLMPFGMRVMLAESPFMWADAAIATTNIVDVWEHYDSNKNEILDRSEVVNLASDLVERIEALYRDMIRKQQPTFSDEEVEKNVRKEMSHALKGDDAAQRKRIMTDNLLRELDVDHDSIITKTEFFFQWKNTAKHWQTIKGVDKGGMNCNIL